MRDFYPADIILRNRIFDAWRKSSRLFGFSEYDACVVETLQLLKRKAGEEILKQIYSFTDKSGRELALRPEMTPTLARMIAARRGSLSIPIKWFTIAQCFRYERTTRGRKREHYQWNLDVVGEESPAAEAEVLAAAVRSLDLLGIDRNAFRIRYSSRSLLGHILEAAGISRDHHAATFIALDKRGKTPEPGMQELLEDAGLDAGSGEKVKGILDISTLEQAADVAGRETPSYHNVVEFLDAASTRGISDVLTFDLSVVRGLAYYTGIVFEAYDAEGKLRAIFGGGRYDDLVGDIGGKPTTGVGLGFGDVVISELLDELGKAGEASPAADVAVGYMEEAQRTAAARAATLLRDAGTSVDLALHPEKAKAFFSRSDKSGFKEAVYIGPDDVAAGKARVKDMATGEEREVRL